MATETKTRSVRIPAAYVERLDALAQQRGCSRSEMLSEALAAYFDVQEWQLKAIQQAIEEADAGDPWIAHEKVEAWLQSWGTDHELPPPHREHWGQVTPAAPR
jgi:RHH-type transcriptional regulator, rel operon repressor / antitoxin RelB